MKTAALVFALIVTVLAVLFFGAVALSRLVRCLGWPQDVLAGAAVLLILLAGMAMVGWKFGELENAEKARTAASP